MSDKEFTPCLIIWQDSATDHGWMDPDLEADVLHKIRTLGFLVSRPKGRLGCYRIAHSEDGHNVNGVIDIPKSCVLEVHELDIDVLTN